MFEAEYDLDDRPCRECGHHITHSRTCTALYCDDGLIDEYEEDAINYSPGEEYSTCDQCHGTGVEWWCPKCGADLSKSSPGDEDVYDHELWNAVEGLINANE